MQQRKKVLIVGAGLGGLSTALRLSSRGYDVEIVEKYHQAGGRLNQIKKEGFTFDVGPSFFSMSYEFNELFKDVGFNPKLEFEELDPLYSVNFAGQKDSYLIYKNLEKLANEFKDIEPDFVRKAEKYLKKAGDLFHSTEGPIIKSNFNSLAGFLGSMTKVPIKYTPMLFRSMWKELDSHFDSEQVKIIFSLVAFFLGATPFDTPSVYSLLNYTELKHDGYWNVKGGMYQIVKVFTEELERRGVKFHFNTEITQVANANGGINSLMDRNGKIWSADLFVINSDAASFRGKILNRQKFSPKKLDSLKWTLAPFTIYLGVKGKVDNLHHHNYFLGNNFKEYASEIFKMQVNPDKPYYYVNVSSKSNPGSAPEGCENLFILCPVPDLRYKSNWADSNELADNIIGDLSSRIGIDLKANTLTRTIWTPEDWQQKFNLYRGSGLGLAHDLNQIGSFRPRNKDEEFNNLYYVGASTTPGTGLPIVVIGSKLVTDRIMQDHEHKLV